MYLWRSPDDTSPLPDVAVHIDARTYRLAELTPEIIQSLNGVLMEGSLVDAQHNRLGYRFLDGRLTWFSFSAPEQSGDPSPNRNADAMAMSIGQGQRFVLPLSSRELVSVAGDPTRAYLSFAQ